MLVTIDGFANFHLKNPGLDLPTIRALARAGVEAESGETVFPSVTHPSHTTLLTGVRPLRHGVINNRMTNRVTGERFHVTNLDRTASVKVPTLFDAPSGGACRRRHSSGPKRKTTPQSTSTCLKCSPRTARPTSARWPRAVLDELRGAGVPIDDYFRYYGDSFLMGTSDIVLAQVGRARDHDAQTVRCWRSIFCSTDEVQHELGAGTLSRAGRADGGGPRGEAAGGCRAEAGIADQTTFVVTADHGFATIDKQVNLGPLFADPALKDTVKLHPQGWSLFVEKTPAFNAARHQAALDQAYQRAASIAGVAVIVRSAEFHALGIPTYDESPFIAGHDMIVGEVDTFLTADAANPSTTRVPLLPPRHEHGYLPTHPKMFTSLVLSGRGVRKGATIGHVRSLDVAPTIAALLGIEMKDVEGRVLTEALK